jgi:GT2 family glycosyltransferase
VPLDVIVVDNASTDGTPEHVHSTFPQAHLVAAETNLGYACGNNIGIRAAMDRNAGFVWVLNNDVTVDVSCLSLLLDAAHANPDAALLGPLVYHFEEPTMIQSAGGVLPRDWHSYHRAANEPDHGQFRAVEPVDWLTGCAILARTSAIQKFGLFDGNFYMYGEDVDWGVRARRAGFGVLLVPRAKVWHKGVRRAYSPAPYVTYYSARNELLLIRKHHAGFSPLFRACARNLRTVASWTIRSGRAEQTLHRDALARALRDAFLGRMGQVNL